jgi:serine protease Do
MRRPVLILHAMAAAVLAIESEAADFTPETIQRAHEWVTPAMCLIAYTMETRNPQTGDVNRRPGFALGLIVSPDGLIVSHGHLLVDNREPTNLTARVGEGNAMKEYPLVLLNKPDDVNLTFLRINADEEISFPHVRFAKNPELQLGEPLLIYGLLGEPLDHARSFQIRRIGAILEQPRTTYALEDSVAFGFVGGPVLNTAGEVVGVIGFDLARNEGGDMYTRSGHPLLYQAPLFQGYIEEPPGEVEARDFAWLGIFSQPLTDDLARYWNLPTEGGVVISTVVPGSPAEDAGLLAGDVIVRFNDLAVTAKTDPDVTSFTRMVRESPIDVPMTLELYRNGEQQTLELSLGTRPTAARDAEQFEDEILGLTVRELTTDSRLALNLADNIEGVIVRSVRSGGPAALGGIRPNFIILGFGRQPVRNLTEYRQVLDLMREAKPEEVTVFCRAGANTAFFRIRPRWDREE